MSKTYNIGVSGGVVVESVFMHDPIRFLAMRGTAFVEYQSLSHSDPLPVAVYHFVTPGGLPEPCRRGAVRPRPRRILLVFVAEEVPIILWSRSYFAFLCKQKIRTLKKKNTPK